jgi:hypothetical protein
MRTCPYISIFNLLFLPAIAVKQCETLFLNHTEGTLREKELIKSVPDMESIGTMISKVKVLSPNIEADKKGGKKFNKKK